MKARALMKARMLPTRAVGLGLAAVCALLVGWAQPADAKTKLRPARELSGLWVGYPGGPIFDTSVKWGEPQKVVLQPEYEARYKARMAALAKGEAEGKPLPNSSALCLPNGMPLTMIGYAPMEIVAKEKTIYVFADGWEPPRRIFMDGRKTPASGRSGALFCRVFGRALGRQHAGGGHQRE